MQKRPSMFIYICMYIFVVILYLYIIIYLNIHICIYIYKSIYKYVYICILHDLIPTIFSYIYMHIYIYRYVNICNFHHLKAKILSHRLLDSRWSRVEKKFLAFSEVSNALFCIYFRLFIYSLFDFILYICLFG
jgi:hypothetical protein